MPIEKKIPLWLAIITNINIVIGSAFFVGAPKIAKAAGPLAPLTWIVIGALLIPLIAALVQLTHKFPFAGGIYVYAQQTLGKFAGFLSGWGYFIGMAIGNAIVLHQITKGLLHIGFLPTLWQNPSINILIFDFLLLSGLTTASLRGIAVLKTLQIAITIFTFIPLLLITVLTPFLGKFQNLFTIPTQPSWFSIATPLVLFAYVGIESCCAIAHSIENGKKNTGKATYISFAITMGIYALVQYGLMALLGSDAATKQPFELIIYKITSNPLIIFWGQKFINFSIIISFSGAVYGIFFSNNWNIYAMAKDGCIAGKKHFFTTLNNAKMPSKSILFQSAIMGIFLFFANSEDALINMNDLGVFIAYVVTSIAFGITQNIATGYTWLIGLLAFSSTSLLLGMCIKRLLTEGLSSIIPFAGVMLIGIISFLFANNKQNGFAS